MWDRWKEWASRLKQNIYALYLAARDPRVPRIAKLLAVMVVAYALSPIDLIPDFIPVLGYLDDLVLLPLGIALVIRMIPQAVWEDCRERAKAQLAQELPRSWIAAAVILGIWLVAVGLVGAYVWQAYR